MTKFAKTTLMLGAAVLALAAGAAQAATACADGTHAADQATCDKNITMAVETESAKVSATGEAPTTGLHSRTPGKPDASAK